MIYFYLYMYYNFFKCILWYLCLLSKVNLFYVYLNIFFKYCYFKFCSCILYFILFQVFLQYFFDLCCIFLKCLRNYFDKIWVFFVEKWFDKNMINFKNCIVFIMMGMSYWGDNVLVVWIKFEFVFRKMRQFIKVCYFLNLFENVIKLEDV